jgi:hypothetical protein
MHLGIEGGMKGGREEGRKGGREEGRKGGREEGRKGGREEHNVTTLCIFQSYNLQSYSPSSEPSRSSLFAR